MNFQNTVLYGPLLYAPQAIGIGLAQLAGLGMAQTLVAARLVNGNASSDFSLSPSAGAHGRSPSPRCCCR